MGRVLMGKVLMGKVLVGKVLSVSQGETQGPRLEPWLQGSGSRVLIPKPRAPIAKL